MTEPGSGRQLRQQKAHQLVGRLLGYGGGAALITSVLLVLTGRSLLWRSIGYALAALAAPILMAAAVRVSSVGDVRSFRRKQRLQLVIVFNVACIVVSLVHAYYVARRLI